ncbi:hypothetical protein HPB50_023139 [Hyalomma asiaticum]|uniref:Uncharacterized protein n=1 Tax=Hyalomma asiaticum TaxID=266040 RepID=A0ACB7T464_HYAAI|nr:hypothetical protein HPB50_023139 [Hyalomma asiaticum]
MEAQRIFCSLEPAVLPSGSTSVVILRPPRKGDTAPTKHEYDSAICLLSAHFKRSVNVIVARQQFRRSAQQEGDTVDEYMTALRIVIAD